MRIHAQLETTPAGSGLFQLWPSCVVRKRAAKPMSMKAKLHSCLHREDRSEVLCWHTYL